ncbi:MAG: hypothetical protein ACXABY_31670, partial [Candidatus Thorarchaeota archaeon]
MSRGRHTHDHELKVDSTTRKLDIIRDENGSALYQVIEEVPKYEPQLKFTQTDWKGGHGQHDFEDEDVFFEGQSIDTTQEGRLFLGPLIYEVKESDDTDLDSAPVCFAWFSATSELLCATSGKIYRYDVGSNGKWTAATTTVSGVTDLIEYAGVMYAARGASTTYSTSTDGDTWTATDLTDDKAVYWLNSPNADGTSNVLWKVKTPNELTETTNGAAGGVQWANPAYVGDTSNNITNIFLVNDAMFIGRTDNLFHYDSSGGLHPLMNDLKHNRNTNNFKYVVDWQTCKYFSLGDGVGEITSFHTFDTMGPLDKIGDIGKKGTCVGLASDKDYLYVAMDEGTNTIIYKMREVRRKGKLRWENDPWVFLSTKTCATMKVIQHSATDRRLWFGYSNTTGYVKLSDNPTDDSNAAFVASGWVRMSYNHGTNPFWDKLIQSIITETVGCTASLTVQPKYRKDTDTSATNLTAAITTNGMVKTNLSGELSCKRIQFELHLATNDSSS